MEAALTYCPTRVLYGVLDLELVRRGRFRLWLPTVSSVSSQRKEYRGLGNWGIQRSLRLVEYRWETALKRFDPWR